MIFASKGKDNKAQRLYTNLFAWGPCSALCMNTDTDSVYRSKENTVHTVNTTIIRATRILKKHPYGKRGKKKQQQQVVVEYTSKFRSPPVLQNNYVCNCWTLSLWVPFMKGKTMTCMQQNFLQGNHKRHGFKRRWIRGREKSPCMRLQKRQISLQILSIWERFQCLVPIYLLQIVPLVPEQHPFYSLPGQCCQDLSHSFL